jgi:hypothetical protein
MKRLLLVFSLVATTLVAHPATAAAKWKPGQAPAEQQEWSLDSSNACAEVFFIGARGSGQNGDDAGPLNMGDQTERLYRLFAEGIHDQPISGSNRLARSAPVGVDYPAAGAFSIVDDTYINSVEEGSQDIQAKIAAITERCGKKTRFVLAGYSQGAQAVTAALTEMTAVSQIDAVVLVASPVFRQGEAGTEYGGPPAGADGILRTLWDLPVPDWIADRTIAVCKPFDIVCTSIGIGHASYDDTILGMAADDAVDWSVDDLTAVPRCDGSRASHVGTNKKDRIRGTSGNDVVYARGGRDNIKTYGGKDKICSHGGGDTIDAGSGRDRVWSGSGGDTVEGKSGNDVIRGGSGDDELLGQGGDDVLHGQGGTDICDGGGGTNTIDASCESSG